MQTVKIAGEGGAAYSLLPMVICEISSLLWYCVYMTMVPTLVSWRCTNVFKNCHHNIPLPSVVVSHRHSPAPACSLSCLPAPPGKSARECNECKYANISTLSSTLAQSYHSFTYPCQRELREGDFL